MPYKQQGDVGKARKAFSLQSCQAYFVAVGEYAYILLGRRERRVQRGAVLAAAAALRNVHEPRMGPTSAAMPTLRPTRTIPLPN